MSKTKKIASPFCTGGGGFDFEELVATTYLIAMLSNDIPRGLEQGYVKSVSFQQKYKGLSVDDIIVTVQDKDVEIRLCLSAKHSLAFTDNKLFNEVIGYCWQDFNKGNLIGIVVAPSSYSQRISRHLQELLNWAKTSPNPSDFLAKANLYKEKKAFTNLFKMVLGQAKKQAITDNELWKFLSSLRVLDFDLENFGSRDVVASLNQLRRSLTNPDIEQAKNLFARLKLLVSKYKKSAGTITIDTLNNSFSKSFSFYSPSNLEVQLKQIKEVCLIQVNNQIQRQKNNKKYIPDVFMEVDEIKEKIRYFVDPVLFWHKTVEDILRTDFSFLNENLKVLGLKPFLLNPPKGLLKDINVDEVNIKCEKLLSFMNTKLTQIEEFSVKNIREKISADKLHYFDSHTYEFGNLWKYKNKIERLIEYTQMLKARVVILTSGAGKGKTNFVCDFAENFINKKSFLSLFFLAKEFDNVTLNNIPKNILDRIFCGSFQGTFDDFLKQVQQICKKDNSTFTIIIDGLNENMNIPVFSKKLEDFIEYLLKYDCIRILVTCRTEYFKQRFSNFKTSSFLSSTIFIDQLHNRMAKQKKDRLFDAYFNFFRISPANIYADAYEKLVDDPLLLRIFCETYGNPISSKKLTILPNTYDIYNDSLFQKYIEKKLLDIAEKTNTQQRGAIKRINFVDVLKNVALNMIEKEIFLNIPLQDIVTSKNENEVFQFVDEEIILHRTLVTNDALDTKNEVLNFTFDEFRDYLLAYCLVKEIYPKDKKGFEEKIDKFVNPKLPISEGLSRYLFYFAKKIADKTLLTILESKKWFQDVFLIGIFSIDDRYVTKQDIELIIEKFKEDTNNSLLIIRSLFVRFDTEIFKNLNIDTLLGILKILNQSEYEKLVNSILDNTESYSYSHRDGWNAADIVKYFNFRKNLQNDVLKKNPQFHNMSKILIFLLGVRHRYDTWREIEELYEEYARRHTSLAIDHLISCANSNVVSVRTVIFSILKKFSAEPKLFPVSFCRNIVEEIMKNKPIPKSANSRLEDSIIDFLAELAKAKPNLFKREEIIYLADNLKHNNYGGMV